MLDASRNAVAKVSTVKDFLLNLVIFGYDALQLYTEDTFEMEGEPFFGYMRGAYTKVELQEIEAFAEELESEEHTSELQSRPHLVCRLLLEKKKKKIKNK